MNIDIPLDLYKIFCAVVKEKNMSLAAKQLYISQPAVSMSVRHLEEKLGKKLLVRSSKGIRPTTEGAVLYEYLVQALNLIKTAEKKYFELVNFEAGEIRISAGDTVINHYLLHYIEAFVNRFPQINVKVTNRMSYETISLLKNGEVDIGFVNLPVEADDSLVIHECAELNDCLVGGSRFEHLKGGIAIKDINDYPLLLLEVGSSTRGFLDEYALNNGVMLKPHIEFGSNDLLVSFAKINLGMTFVTREFYQGQINNVSLFEIPVYPAPPSRSLGLATLNRVAASNAAIKFAQLMGITL